MLKHRHAALSVLCRAAVARPSGEFGCDRLVHQIDGNGQTTMRRDIEFVQRKCKGQKQDNRQNRP
jgi:hypothetical protein